jgi:hypothetical protein
MFRMIIPLNLIEPSSLVAGDSVLLVENPGGICLVRQIKSGSNGMVSSMTTSASDFKHLLSWET